MSKVTVVGQFDPGAKVEVRERPVGAVFSRGAKVVKTVKASKAGDVELTGLKAGAGYWLSTEDGAGIAVTAKEPVEPVKASLSAKQVNERLAQTRPAAPAGAIVEGARSTGSVRRVPPSSSQEKLNAERQPAAKRRPAPKRKAAAKRAPAKRKAASK